MRSIYVRISAGVLFLVWAILHAMYGAAIVRVAALRVVGYFFIIDAALAVVAAILLFLDIRVMLIPILIYTWINYLLLTESRIFPAPVLGYVIPVIDPTVIGVMVLDIILIALVTALWVMRRG